VVLNGGYDNMNWFSVKKLCLVLLVVVCLVIAGCNSSTSQSPPPPASKEEPLIPYGTYAYTPLSYYTATITLNSNGTYKANGIYFESNIEVGTYNVSADYISFTSDASGYTWKYKYRYSDQFDCLYIFMLDADFEPQPFFKR